MTTETLQALLNQKSKGCLKKHSLLLQSQRSRRATHNPEDFAKGFRLLRAATSHWTVGFTNFPLPAHLAKNLADDYVSMRVNLEDNEAEVDEDEKEAE